MFQSGESVEKVDTLTRGNAVRSKIKDFRTALYPRQYHLSVLEKPLIKRLFAYKVFFRRTCRRKNKIRLTAAEKLNLRFIDRLTALMFQSGFVIKICGQPSSSKTSPCFL